MQPATIGTGHVQDVSYLQCIYRNYLSCTAMLAIWQARTMQIVCYFPLQSYLNQLGGRAKKALHAINTAQSKQPCCQCKGYSQPGCSTQSERPLH